MTRVILVLITLAFAEGCTTPGRATGRYSAMAPIIERIRLELPKLDLQGAWTPSSESMTQYLDYYGLMPTGVTHSFGTFHSGGRRLMAHVYRPQKSRGSVILVHGYCDHAGIWRNLLTHLLDQQYTVALYELPGHGLSEGDRVSIRFFSEYVTSLQDFVSLCRKDLDGPFHIVAHSMGAGITADYLLSSDPGQPDGRIVLLGPLIRPAHPYLSRWGVEMVSPFCRSLPRWFSRNSSDPTFLQFVRADPLQARHCPIQFCQAMFAWNESLRDRQAVDKEILIIQGKSDTTVDWRFNTRFIKTKFPHAEIRLIGGARHQLANECETLRGQVFDLIDAYIQCRSLKSSILSLSGRYDVPCLSQANKYERSQIGPLAPAATAFVDDPPRPSPVSCEGGPGLSRYTTASTSPTTRPPRDDGVSSALLGPTPPSVRLADHGGFAAHRVETGHGSLYNLKGIAETTGSD